MTTALAFPLLSAALLVPRSGPSLALPANLRVDRAFACVVQVMAERSPTFRRQLARLAATPELTVIVRPSGIDRDRDARALTRFARAGADLRGAEVLVARDQHAMVPELIGHELEHVIEQLDQADLPRHAEAHASGVTRGPRDAVFAKYFETERAREIGRKVSREVGPIPRCEPASS
jgi:hypothetical protein